MKILNAGRIARCLDGFEVASAELAAAATISAAAFPPAMAALSPDGSAP